MYYKCRGQYLARTFFYIYRSYHTDIHHGPAYLLLVKDKDKLPLNRQEIVPSDNVIFSNSNLGVHSDI